MAFERLKYFARGFRQLLTSTFIRKISEVIDDQCVASERMLEAIDSWLDMYAGFAPWLISNPQSLGLPAIIAAEIARCVTLEMEMTVTGSPMADFISEQMEPVLKNIRNHTEYACAGGGVVFKPYVYNDKITTEIIHANMFYPTSFNSDLKITAAYFVYRHYEGREIYTRLEKHILDGSTYTITNKAYRSMFEESLGTECSLAEVNDWADIEPIVTLSGVEAPLFAYFRIPIGNTIDQHSPLGASVYSRAVSLIEDADKQYQRLMWEYEGGELAIDASEDVFKHRNGEPVLPENKERLFRMNNIDTAVNEGEPLKAWSPTLRDSNYVNGLNRVLMQIEDACYLARGTLSDPAVVSRTATELNLMKQRTYVNVRDTQASLQSALDDLVYAMYCIASLYDLCPDGAYETSYLWDDSIINDAETERMRDQQEVRDGLMSKWEYRVKWYGEDEKQARKMIDEIQGETDDQILFGDEPDINGNPPKEPIEE